jgi:hypothetical protein
MRPTPGDELADRVGEIVHAAERLRQERQGVLPNEARILVGHPARKEEDALFELGPREARALKELDATELRHSTIADHHVEALAGGEALERANGLRADFDAEAGAPQQSRVRCRDRRLVVHEEH